MANNQKSERFGPYRSLPHLHPCCRMRELHPRRRYAGAAALISVGGRNRSRSACRRPPAASHHPKSLSDPGRRRHACATMSTRRRDCSGKRPSVPTGKLRIDVPGRTGRLIIAPALQGFLARHPQLDIELRVTDRAVNLMEDSIDCVLRDHLSIPAWSHARSATCP